MTPACPGPAALRRMLAADPAAAPEPGLLGHLGECAVCRERIEAMAGGVGWVPDVVALGAQTPTPPQLSRLLRRIAGLRPLGGSGWQPRSPVARPGPEAPGRGERFGPYQILALAGTGGMGIVLKARDLELDRVVALKIQRRTLAADARARAAFLREARAMAAVTHDHVVAIHAVGEQGGRPYLVMQWVRGESLRARIEAVGRLDPMSVLRIGEQAALGLAAAHASGLIHRDIKPANLLLQSDDDSVKITDFGLALTLSGSARRGIGDAAGTPGFAAPEQTRGGAIDDRADLFGLGATLYAACHGRSPLTPMRGTDGRSRRVVAAPPLHAAHPELPESLCALVDAMLATDPARRPASATSVAQACRRLRTTLVDGAAVSAPD